MLVTDLGEIESASDGFVTKDAIYPVGYRTEVKFASPADPRVKIAYECLVGRSEGGSAAGGDGKDSRAGGGSGPSFTVTPEGFPQLAVTAATPNQVWQDMEARLTRLSTVPNRYGLNTLVATIDGGINSLDLSVDELAAFHGAFCCCCCCLCCVFVCFGGWETGRGCPLIL